MLSCVNQHKFQFYSFYYSRTHYSFLLLFCVCMQFINIFKNIETGGKSTCKFMYIHNLINMHFTLVSVCMVWVCNFVLFCTTTTMVNLNKIYACKY